MSAELELQGALVATLEANASLSALVQDRIFDLVPADAAFPYVAIGEAQNIRDDAVGVDGGEVRLTLHAWSIEPGLVEVKRVASAVVDALHLAPLSLPSWRLVSLMHRQTRTFRDADGVTSHAVIECVANVEKLIA